MKMLMTVVAVTFAGAVHAECAEQGATRFGGKSCLPKQESRQVVAPAEVTCSSAEACARLMAEEESQHQPKVRREEKARAAKPVEKSWAEQQAEQAEARRNQESSCRDGDRDSCAAVTERYESLSRSLGRRCFRGETSICAESRDTYREFLMWEGLRRQAKK